VKVRFDALLLLCARIVRNTLIDLRFGSLPCLNIKTWRNNGLFFDAHTDYAALSYIFKNRIKASDVLIDIGCRKGRVINWWLSQGLRNRMVGIELDEKIANETRIRLRRYENVSIITGDANHNIPADGTLFYLYNPFPAPVVKAFKDCLMSIFGKRGNITLLYYNCEYVDIFQQDPAWNVEITDVGRHSPLPFSQLAVIKLSRQPVPDNESGAVSPSIRS
jgi:hypothetical protein